MYVPPARASNQRCDDEWVPAAFNKHVNVAALAGLPPGVGPEQPGAAALPFAACRFDGLLNPRNNVGATRLRGLAVPCDLFDQAFSNGATECLQQIWIGHLSCHRGASQQ